MTETVSATNLKINRDPCPSRSAELVFEPKDGCLMCPYCGCKEDIPIGTGNIHEWSYEDFLNIEPGQVPTAEADVLEVNCASCGASVVFALSAVAGQCAFCASPIGVQPAVPNPMLAAESVLPFSFPQARAVEAIRSWLASRWFAPNSLVQLARQERVNGVYLTYWTFDASTVSHCNGGARRILLGDANTGGEG